MKISMGKTLRAMSIALDLSQRSSDNKEEIIEDVTNINYSKHKFINHSQRATYIALELSKVLNLNISQQMQLYASSLLHDIGAANYFFQSHSSNSFIRQHCESGAKITKNFPLFPNMSDIILNHHENFNGSGPFKVIGRYIPIESQLIRLADLIELLYNENLPSFKQKNYIIDWVKSHTNSIFSPSICEAFLNLSSKDIFWFNIENIASMDFILDSVAPNIDLYLNIDEFEEIAYIFASIIDNKSKFTATHSRSIAELAFNVAKFMDYPRYKCRKMKIAGLLHDIGKLSIPCGILDKDGSLSSEEFSIIKSHVYYTKVILDRIGNIDDISDWASNHHEKLNGKGYPRGLTSDDLSEECRIIAICDIYQALTEDRPYRKGLDNEKAFSIMESMVSQGFICGTALKNLKDTIYFSYKDII